MSEVVATPTDISQPQPQSQQRSSFGSGGIFPIHLRRGSGTSSQASKKLSHESLRRPSSADSLTSKNSYGNGGPVSPSQIGGGRPGLLRRPSALSNVVRYNDGLSFEDSSEEEISQTDIALEIQQGNQDIPALAVQAATPDPTRYSFEPHDDADDQNTRSQLRET